MLKICRVRLSTVDPTSGKRIHSTFTCRRGEGRKRLVLGPDCGVVGREPKGWVLRNPGEWDIVTRHS